MYDEFIRQVQERWERIIIQYASDLFLNHWLPSHNISHHKRVWKNACLLLPHLNLNSDTQTETFFEQLLFACYFHDLGLIYDKGPNHGKESVKICKEFFGLHRDRIRFNSRDVEWAIEHHDDKDYKLKKVRASAIYRMLALADDLDALGAIGCYRYIEIYLMRSLKPVLIPGLILENAEKRFDNLLANLKSTGVDALEIKKRYDLLKVLLGEDHFIENPASLVIWIYEEIVLKQMDPFIILTNERFSGSSNSRINSFLDHFIREAG